MATILFIYIVFIIILLFASSKKYVNLKQGKYLLIGSVFLLALLTALVVPKTGYDLTRHFADLEIIKNADIKFWDFVFNSEKVSDPNYRHTYTFNALRFVIAKYLPKEALPFSSIFICYGVFGYILHDIKKRGNISNVYLGFSVLISNCFLPILYVYSGVRTEIAMAIIALAVYLKIYKNLKIVPLAVLIVVAATMHPLALAAVPPVFLAKFHPGKKGLILVLLIPSVLYALMNYFRFSNYDFLRYLGVKFYNYTFVNTYSQGRTFYYAAILMTTMVLVLSVLKIRQESKKDRIFANFLSWYCIFILANVRSYQISTRLPYLCAFLAPAIVYILFKYTNYVGWKKLLLYFSVGGTLMVSMYTLYSNYLWMG